LGRKTFLRFFYRINVEKYGKTYTCLDILFLTTYVYKHNYNSKYRTNENYNLIKQARYMAHLSHFCVVQMLEYAMCRIFLHKKLIVHAPDTHRYLL
jgi:hypothetical protein